MSTPDYAWLLEAAGLDAEKLAHLSLILAAESMMLAHVMSSTNKTDVLAHIKAIRHVMVEISRRIAENPPDPVSTGG